MPTNHEYHQRINKILRYKLPEEVVRNIMNKGTMVATGSLQNVAHLDILDFVADKILCPVNNQFSVPDHTPSGAYWEYTVKALGQSNHLPAISKNKIEGFLLGIQRLEAIHEGLPAEAFKHTDFILLEHFADNTLEVARFLRALSEFGVPELMREVERKFDEDPHAFEQHTKEVQELHQKRVGHMGVPNQAGFNKVIKDFEDKQEHFIKLAEALEDFANLYNTEVLQPGRGKS